MTKIIAVVNQKGGDGKTTTAVNLSAFLNYARKRVVLFDLDPQANATSGVGATIPDEMAVLKILEDSSSWQEQLVDAPDGGFQLLPSSPKGAREIPRHLLEQRVVDGIYQQIKSCEPAIDYIIIDCPPAVGPLSNLALSLSDSVLIPVQCEYYAMEGLSQMLPIIEQSKENRTRPLEIEGLLLTMFDANVALSREVLTEVQKYFPQKTLTAVIPRDVVLAEAASHGKPIWDYSLRCPGNWAYLNLAKEIISHE